jgi:hypothetical protein
MINEDVRFRRYKVRMHGSSMSASYTGTADVWASDSDDAIERAFHELLNARTGTFSDWGPIMFRVLGVEEAWS